MPENNHVCGVCGAGYYCCNASEAYNSPKKIACSDECFKAWIAWIDYRDGRIDRDEYIQRIDASGLDLIKLHGVMADAYYGDAEKEPAEAKPVVKRKAGIRKKEK